jgi:hypothetical protein
VRISSQTNDVDNREIPHLILAAEDFDVVCANHYDYFLKDNGASVSIQQGRTSQIIIGWSPIEGELVDAREALGERTTNRSQL